MTRINAAIPVANLTDEHLRAELVEIIRVPSEAIKRIEKGRDFSDVPEKFVLGPGHVKFFMNKPFEIMIRFTHLCKEYKRRFNKDWHLPTQEKMIKNCLYLIDLGVQTPGWIPTNADRDLVRDRISTRIVESKKQMHFYGAPIDKNKAVELLK